MDQFVFEIAVVSLVGLNLFVTVYAAWRAPQVLARPFISALGQKEGELLVLRATLQQYAQQMQARMAAEKVVEPKKK